MASIVSIMGRDLEKIKTKKDEILRALSPYITKIIISHDGDIFFYWKNVPIDCTKAAYDLALYVEAVLDGSMIYSESII